MLKCDVGLSYRKIREVPNSGNTPRCLTLRQKYGMFLLKALHDGKRLINVDESFINSTDFHRRCWRRRGEAITEPDSEVAPRISLLLSMDTDGRLHYSLTQVNTDARVFGLFVARLIDKLNKENPGWRENSILVLDGAKYHNCDQTKKLVT